MYIQFKDLPADARIWVYQSNRDLTETEKSSALTFLTEAVENWVTHGMPMRGSVNILFNRLVLVAADTAFQQPSGCSIDASTDWLQELGRQMGVDFFDRSIGYFEGEELKSFSVFEARKHVLSGLVQPGTRIINAQVGTIAEWEDRGIIPAGSSFLNRYFPVIEA